MRENERYSYKIVTIHTFIRTSVSNLDMPVALDYPLPLGELETRRAFGLCVAIVHRQLGQALLFLLSLVDEQKRENLN
jgi:hypothetical protein